MFLNFLLSSGEGDTSCLSGGNGWIFFVLIGVMVLFMGWSIFSSRKRGKQMNDMRSTMRLGDEVMTIGGVVGTIVEIREKSAIEKEFVIETGMGDNKSTMTFDMRALGENRTRMKEIQAEAAKQAELARQQREAKKISQGKIESAEKTQPQTESQNEPPSEEDNQEK